MKDKQTLLYSLKFLLCAMLITSVALALGSAVKGIWEMQSINTSGGVASTPAKRVIVIDAGHGGEDAGAVAGDGTLEKDLNLEIASLIKALCDLNGTRAVMTRSSDTLLYDYYNDLEDYTGHKKMYDLRNRVKITQEYENAIYLGIHMNKFSLEKYSGAQVYYSKNDTSSEILARNIQNSTKLYLQKNNKRQVKPATSSIYVLNSLHCPAVLVECGFLSNQSELELLKDEEYRAKLALVIFSTVI